MSFKLQVLLQHVQHTIFRSIITSLGFYIILHLRYTNLLVL